MRIIIRLHSLPAINRNEYTVPCTRRYWFIMIQVIKAFLKVLLKMAFIRAGTIKKEKVV